PPTHRPAEVERAAERARGGQAPGQVERGGRVNCEAVGHLMDDLLDNALSQRELELLEEHLVRCPRCRSELRQRPAFERGIRRALATSVQPMALPSAFGQGLVDAAQKSL